MQVLTGILLVLCQGGPASAPAAKAALSVEKEDPDFAQLDREDRLMQALAERARRAYVSVTAERGPQEIVFSGTLLDGQGHIAVPASGVHNATKIFARCDGRTFAADVRFEDPTFPIAILRLRTNSIDAAPPAPAVAEEGSLAVGHRVTLVSNANDFDGTTQFGRVSGLDRCVPLFPSLRLVQTTIHATAGSPGGVLTNGRGEVVGVLLGGAELNVLRIGPVGISIQGPMAGDARGTEVRPVQSSQNPSSQNPAGQNPMQAGDGVDPNAQARLAAIQAQAWARFNNRAAREAGISLVLPIAQLANILHNLDALRAPAPAAPPDGTPYMGVFLREGLDDALRAALELEPGVGLLVDDIVEASPAKAAGIRRFDVLVKLDGEPVRTNTQFRQRLVAAASRGAFDIDLLRGAKALRVRVDLASVK
jgi:S1-C subfamily serine protease